jgi:hypothetical protein
MEYLNSSEGKVPNKDADGIFDMKVLQNYVDHNHIIRAADDGSHPTSNLPLPGSKRLAKSTAKAKVKNTFD